MDDHSATFEALESPRRRALRWVTIVVLAIFLLVTVVTGAVSLGAYCLTTDGADTRALPAAPGAAP
jgi:hypothetical protein